MEKFIPLSVPNIGVKEEENALDALRSGWVVAGEYIHQLEKRFSEYARVESSAAVQSGTAAIHLALIECGVGKGDLVIVPTLTFIASVNPVHYVGAEPVFIDCGDDLCIDTLKLENYLRKECEIRDGVLHDMTLDKPVKALIAVHVFGNCADMEYIMGLAARHGLLVIEDAAEAIGSFIVSGKYTGQMAGTIGDFGAYSFNGNKIITTGGGGMLVSKDPEKLKHARYLSSQAKDDEVYFDHKEVGYNYRMSNLQASIGVAQMEKLECFINCKRINYLRYADNGVTLLPFSIDIRPNYWFYCYVTTDRDGLIKYMGANNVQVRPIWKLIHTLPMYKHCRAYHIEKAYNYYESVVNIPCSSSLTAEEVMRVAALIRKFEDGVILT